MCGKMVTSCGMTRTSHCALHLRARAEHMNNTNAHTTIHNPYGIAGVRSSTIKGYAPCRRPLARKLGGAVGATIEFEMVG